jgi:dolichol-phosphate mannosyltransferase
MSGVELGRWARWAKFNAAGAAGVLVQLVVLWVLRQVDVNYLVATVVAVEAAVLHNFLWHERWTWRHRSLSDPAAWPLRLLKFQVTNGIFSVLGNLLLMGWLVGTLRGPVMLSNLISIGLCSTANFLAADSFVYRTRAKTPARGGDGGS